MKLLIIGAGWYGSHISKKCLEAGHTVTIVDKENDFFCGSSYKNQNRLHLGFHYPRSEETIQECVSGFSKFKTEYPQLSKPIPMNVYFLVKEDSKISFENFKNVFSEKNIHFHVLSTNSIFPCLTNVEELSMKVDEEYIDFQKAKSYFQNILGKNLIRIEDTSVFHNIEAIQEHTGNSFDYILNCTYNQLHPIPYEKYELYLTLIYKIDSYDTFAYTLMDGPFFSIYPYDVEKKLYTVTSVQHGVIYEGESLPMSTIDSITLFEKIQTIEKMILQYIPSWQAISSYDSYFTSLKTKPTTQTDDRSLRYSVEGNLINFYGGKITGIFHAEEILRNLKIL